MSPSWIAYSFDAVSLLHFLLSSFLFFLSLSLFHSPSLSSWSISPQLVNVALGAGCVLIFEIVWHLSSKVFPGVAMSVDDGAPAQQCSQATNQATNQPAKQLAQLAAKQPRASREHGNLQLQF